MREIKYRAWLVNAQRMINVQEINFYNGTVSYIENDYVNLEQGKTNVSRCGGIGRHSSLRN